MALALSDQRTYTAKVSQKVVDLEGVRVICLNTPLGSNYCNFMEKFMKNQVKC